VGSDKALGSGSSEAGDRKPGARLVAATVVEERPSATYVVVLEGRQQVLAHLVGVVKRNFVRLVPGDRVEVELAPHDPTRGRITRKLAS
jgi:translation initiation factor IF-1